MDTLISALVGFFSGAVASIVAPWVQSAIENRRSKIAYRRSQIQRWRNFIESFDFSSNEFGETSVYAEIRQFLDKEIIRQFEQGRTYVVLAEGRGENSFKILFLDEISRVEKSWGLI